ncbi:MAG: DNA alkylation repair protein [Prosthecobacter sp.]|nr:DNA alkylation repair protein [Prosthecobacter sp.]
MSEPIESPAPALKDWFDAKRFRLTAKQITALYPAFDTKHFLALALPGLDDLTLMQRLRRMTESLHATLPGNYRKTLAILRKLAPNINHGFVTLVLPDYVGVYGQDDFDTSMDALAFFTTFGSSEFAVREFLRRDLTRTLAVMEKWSRSESDHVRRLASEGSRPRLPWSFRLDALIADPSPAIPILENLRADPSLYVRKSVANHLNDITKDHPTWVLDRLEAWPLENAHTAWIAKRALRTLIKKGDSRALALIGAGEKPKVLIHDLTVQPRAITLGGRLTLAFRLESRSSKAQRLVIDYIIHYVKKSGGTSGKVFKWKELTLAPGASVTLTRTQAIRDFTTRLHHPGRHDLEIMVNGQSLAQDFFDLSRT